MLYLKSVMAMKLSKGAQQVYHILRKANLPFQLEYEFIDLVGKKKVPLRYDFAILSGGQPIALIEYDGEAHFKQIKHFQTTMDKFKQSQERDRKKNQYALMHNIPLYRIPYWDIDNINNINDILQLKYRVKTKYHNDLIAP